MTTEPANLDLFDEPMTLERAREIARRYPVNARLKQAYQRCTGACCRAKSARGHGPNWVAWVRLGAANWRQLYIGPTAKKDDVVRAWGVLDAERRRLEAALEATPEACALRELVAGAFMSELSKPRRKPPEAVDVPIVDFGPTEKAG